MDKSLSQVLQVRDVFSTMEHVSIISLSASYRLNNFKQSKRGNGSGGGGGEEF